MIYLLEIGGNLIRLGKKEGLGWMKWIENRESYLGHYRAGKKNGFGMYEWDEDKGNKKYY